MLRVGLTGGIACGKTTVSKIMEAMGAYVVQADIIAHELMQPGEAVYSEVVKRFGPSIVNKDGGAIIDREKLGAIAFGEGRIDELNALVHPAVIRRQEEWMREIGLKDPMAVAVVEAALILEAGVNGRFDKLVVVTCAEESRRSRFVERAGSRGIGREAAARQFEKILAAQMPEADKVKYADFVIDNSGSLDHTRLQTEKVMKELQSLAAAK